MEQMRGEDKEVIRHLLKDGEAINIRQLPATLPCSSSAWLQHYLWLYLRKKKNPTTAVTPATSSTPTPSSKNLFAEVLILPSKVQWLSAWRLGKHVWPISMVTSIELYIVMTSIHSYLWDLKCRVNCVLTAFLSQQQLRCWGNGLEYLYVYCQHWVCGGGEAVIIFFFFLMWNRKFAVKRRTLAGYTVGH